MSSECNNIKLAIRNDKFEIVCAMCKQCLITANHDVCVLNYVNGMNSRGKQQKANVSNIANQSKHKPQVWKPKNVGSKERLASPKPSKPRMRLRWSPTGRIFDLCGKLIRPSDSEFFGNRSLWNDHVAAILGFGDLQWGNILITGVYFIEGLGHNLFSNGLFCDSDLEVAFRRNTCFVRNLEGVDLLKGNRTTNLYTINLHDMAFTSPICLMARATSTKSWLWHQRALCYPKNDREDIRKLGAKATPRTFLAAQASQVLQTPMATTTTANTVPTPTNSFSQATNFPNTSQDVDELKTQQQHVQHQPTTIADNVLNAMFDDNTLWTKDHPLKQVIGEPSCLVLTRNQLRSDGDMFLYALTVSTMEPKNVKEAMTDPAWIESMQEELLQFKRLDVWVLVPAPDNIKPLTLKWLSKNKHDEENTVIGNKTHLVVRGYRQEEGIDFEESFAPSNYVLEILGKYRIESCDPVGTPMEIKDKLDLDQHGSLVDATKYRSMIGALMYLMSTRPDIVHETCLCARYQANPTEKHLKEIKRIFHYLRGTINTGLWYTKDYGFELTGFSDADYAGCKDTFRSTSSGA
ncbi:retrovirus-related pol polyprotein from transposon TNT 1-94 [Tanacetum coccineum]|uniref:Retrovirus-related pol polyprotein from transposon TNT 1-94 n=1 Tax=Tanacetum coccineum TaxID=301880 RepID=A0ABQ5FQ84_9ASTR